MSLDTLQGLDGLAETFHVTHEDSSIRVVPTIGCLGNPALLNEVHFCFKILTPSCCEYSMLAKVERKAESGLNRGIGGDIRI